MSADWDYAQMAKTASEHGGPEAFLDFVKDVAKGEGRIQGLAIGTTAATVLGIGGTKAYGYWRAWQAKKALAAIAEDELLRGMNESLNLTEPGPENETDGDDR